MAKAHVYKRGHVNTDEIIPARYLNTDDEAELAGHCLEDLEAIRGAKVQTVIAKSFARIFYRNAINNGFYIIELPDALEKISDGDELQIDYKNGLIKNKTAGIDISFNPLPDFALEIINDGGLLEHITKKQK